MKKAEKFDVPASLIGTSPEIQGWYLSQYRPWVAFFRKAGGNFVRGGKKWRGRIQATAQHEIARTIAACVEQDAPFGALACKKGCAHCCHFHVDINTLEADRLADIVRQMPEARREEVVARLDAARDACQHADRDPGRYRHPCPFLEGSECSVYDDRPLACRSHVSSYVTFCITELSTPSGMTISDASDGVPSGATMSSIVWTIMLRSISLAANHLIGGAGSLPAAVLKRVVPDVERHPRLPDC
jgi:hypothetical protein